MARKTANLNVRLDSELKKEVQRILETLGLSPTEAVRAYFKQIQLRKGLPFEIRIPNETTRQTIERMREEEEVDRFESTEELFEDLGI
mgnify:FL=1